MRVRQIGAKLRLQSDLRHENTQLRVRSFELRIISVTILSAVTVSSMTAIRMPALAGHRPGERLHSQRRRPSRWSFCNAGTLSSTLRSIVPFTAMIRGARARFDDDVDEAPLESANGANGTSTHSAWRASMRPPSGRLGDAPAVAPAGSSSISKPLASGIAQNL